MTTLDAHEIPPYYILDDICYGQMDMVVGRVVGRNVDGDHIHTVVLCDDGSFILDIKTQTGASPRDFRPECILFRAGTIITRTCDPSGMARPTTRVFWPPPAVRVA